MRIEALPPAPPSLESMPGPIYGCAFPARLIWDVDNARPA